MKKRMMGILLALSLCLTLLPIGVGAAYVPTNISEVSINVPAPSADSGLTAPTVESNTPYFVSDSKWTRVTAKGCVSDVDGWGAGSGTFVADSWYLLNVELLLDYGYRFGDSITASVSGAEQVEVRRYKDDAVYVNAWFKVGEPSESPTEISTVSISNVSASWTGDISDWEDNILDHAAVGPNCRISYTSLSVWSDTDSHWNYCSFFDSVESDAIYGVNLTINALSGCVFGDSITATVNGKAAEIIEKSADTVELFVPFGTVTIDKAEVDSDTWPIEGNTIRKDPDNFSVDAEYVGYTLESAQFQILENGNYRNLKDNETTFSSYSKYRVTAVLKAKNYATFASSVTGDFNGSKNVSCTVSADGKTCTVTRSCAVYDAIYTYNVNSPSSHTNGADIYRPDPAAGQTVVLGEFAPTAGQVRLCGANANTGWYEVPCIGSTVEIRHLSSNDTYEAGKVYLSTMTLSNKDDYRFGEGFTVSLKQPDGSDSNYAQLEWVCDDAREKKLNVWYTVGNMTQQAITQITITGPEFQSGTIDTSDPSQFNTNDNITISTPQFNPYTKKLSFNMVAKSGYYFGRTVGVTYNGKTAVVSNAAFSSRFDTKAVRVDCATPITVSGIEAQSRKYDGTTKATLTGGTLTGVAAGDDVTLILSDVTAEFASKDVGNNIAVTVKGGMFDLRGKDAYKYNLTTQPTDLSGLKANITYATAQDTTILAQTIRIGDGSSFRYPSFKGVGSEPATGTVSYTYKINNDTQVYRITDDTTIPAILNRLSAGDKAYIGYEFTGSGNYSPTQSLTGTITITMRARSNSTSSGFSSYEVYVAEASNGSVTASPKNASKGDTVTITIKPDSGYTLEALTVTDADGNELTLTDLGSARYSFTMPASRVEVKATFMEDNSLLNFFYDVPNSAYYYEAIKWAVEQGVTTGIGNDAFGPDLPCTRAQIVTFLWRAAGSPEPKAVNSFSDVPSDGYYAKAVAWAIENGVTTGVGGGRFAPNDTCTRAQAVTFFARALSAKAEGSAAFSDVPADSYYADAVAWAAASGITEGIGGGLFGPANDCTRAQIVTFLYRAYSK